MHAKTLLTVAAAFLALNLPLSSAHAHADHGKPQFGGVVAEAGMAQFEVVGREGKVTVHVTQHGQPLSSAGANGKLTVLDGTNKQELALKPAGDNRLEAAGRIPPQAKLLLQIQLAGEKPLQARAVWP